ncbi:MAG: YraN family protein [Armatimonadota bacterium]
MPTEKSLLGKRAEGLAAGELTRRGYEVIETNYRCRYGEIDIIACDRGSIVFVEVRSRRSDFPVFPAESVNRKKQSKLIITAKHYLSSKNASDSDCRFDVVEVKFERGKPVSVEIIQNAFGE